jgi:hypothetical protein
MNAMRQASKLLNPVAKVRARSVEEAGRFARLPSQPLAAGNHGAQDQVAELGRANDERAQSFG